VTSLLTPPVQLTLPPHQLHPLNPATALDDLAQYAHLHVPEAVYGVCRRGLEGRPVTRAGPKLWLVLGTGSTAPPLDRSGISLLDPMHMARYRSRIPHKLLDALPPSRRGALTLPAHVYGMADEMLTAACSDLVPHTLVVTGDSGSGKTALARAVVQYWITAPCLDALGARPGAIASLVAKSMPLPTSAVGSSRGASALSPPRGVGLGSAAGAGGSAASGHTAATAPSHPALPALLTAPDVGAAVGDAASRRGPLGSPTNPLFKGASGESGLGRGWRGVGWGGGSSHLSGQPTNSHLASQPVPAARSLS